MRAGKTIKAKELPLSCGEAARCALTRRTSQTASCHDFSPDFLLYCLWNLSCRAKQMNSFVHAGQCPQRGARTGISKSDKDVPAEECARVQISQPKAR